MFGGALLYEYPPLSTLQGSLLYFSPTCTLLTFGGHVMYVGFSDERGKMGSECSGVISTKRLVIWVSFSVLGLLGILLFLSFLITTMTSRQIQGNALSHVAIT